MQSLAAVFGVGDEINNPFSSERCPLPAPDRFGSKPSFVFEKHCIWIASTKKESGEGTWSWRKQSILRYEVQATLESSPSYISDTRVNGMSTAATPTKCGMTG